MGYNTTLFILNDAWGQIEKDPVGFVKELNKRHVDAMGKPQEFGFGNYGNGFWIVANHHASETKVIAVGGNYVTILGSYYGSAHHRPEDIEALLREIASQHGFRLVRKEGEE